MKRIILDANFTRMKQTFVPKNPSTAADINVLKESRKHLESAVKELQKASLALRKHKKEGGKVGSHINLALQDMNVLIEKCKEDILGLNVIINLGNLGGHSETLNHSSSLVSVESILKHYNLAYTTYPSDSHADLYTLIFKNIKDRDAACDALHLHCSQAVFTKKGALQIEVKE